MATEFNQWANCPINLSREELENPFKVIDSFFSVDDVQGHLKELQKWRGFAIGNGYYTDEKGNPSGLLFTYEMTVKLIEAASVLKTEPWLTNLMKQRKGDHREQLETERKTWSHFPNNLNETELLNPGLVISQFFSDYSLAEYRSQLYEWLEYGLSSKPAREFLETTDLIAVYENIQKLYGGIWLIQKRIKCDAMTKTKDDEHRTRQHFQLYELHPMIAACNSEKLCRITAAIKHKLNSAFAIIYLGAKPHDAENIFLLVLTPDSEQREALSLGTMLEESCRPNKVIVLVHCASAALKAVHAGDRFFSRALSCPALYLSGELLLPNANLTCLNRNMDLSEANWERWRKQGKEFLSGAKYYLSAGAASAALFSLHQCTECILVAIVRAVLGYRINSHNLLRLLRVTQFFTNDLTAVFKLNSDEGKEHFETLKEAYINVRYRDTYEPDPHSVDTLYQTVSKLVSIAELVHEQFLMKAVL